MGTGRAFGGGVAYPTVRPGEPSVFRRCYFLALDWVGDTAAVLVGGWEKTMPEHPHVVFEDCTLVHTDNAVAMSYASHCARAKFVNCRMIVLNFTQPEMGGKSTGIICTQGHSPTGRLHVDLEDCILAGYSLFTPGEDGKAVTYTTKGKVQAYVQFKQEVPAGFERLGLWPTELFAQIAPPASGSALPMIASRPVLTKLPLALPKAMENTPVVFNGRPLLVLNHRDDTKNKTDGYTQSMYLYAVDLATGEEVCPLRRGAFVRQRLRERARAARLRQRRDQPRLVPEPLSFLDHRPEDLEARAGDRAGRRRAPVQLLGLPRRDRVS